MSNRALKAIKKEREEFKQLFSYWKTVSGSLTGILTFIPVSGVFIESLLPGVLRILAPVLAVSLSLLVILHLFFRYRDRTAQEIDKAARTCFCLGLLMLCCFVLGWLTWIVEAGGDWHIAGLTLTDEAARAVSQGNSPDDPKVLLDRFGHNSENRIWQWRNLATALLAFSFSGFFAFTAGSFLLSTLKRMK